MVVVEKEWCCLWMMLCWYLILVSSTSNNSVSSHPMQYSSWVIPGTHWRNSVQNSTGIIWSIWQGPLPNLITPEFQELPGFWQESVEEVLSVPPLFLLDSSQSCRFQWNSSRIYQPKFHSCHRIVSFQYLHWNGPQSLVTGMALESSDRNWAKNAKYGNFALSHEK